MNIPHDSAQLDDILGALANQKRRAIIHELSLQPSTVGQLARRNELSLPAIHKHIRTLENATHQLCGSRQHHIWISPKLDHPVSRCLGQSTGYIRKLCFQDEGMIPGLAQLLQ
jgi:hypothetical protein